MEKFLHIKSIPHKGRGVFTRAALAKGSLIEKAPVLTFCADQWQTIETTLFFHYVFDWGSQGGGAIALGYGSIYNHSYSPNAYYVKENEQKELHFFALRDIEEGEEICINYNGIPHCQDPVWFDVV